MTTPATFPVLGTDLTVPFAFVAAHQTQAVRNHGQSVHRLAERGGLSWQELMCVVSDKPATREALTTGGLFARRAVREREAKWKRERETEVTANVGDGATSLFGGAYMKRPTCRD